MAAGIEKRGDGYRASVWSPRERKLIRKTFRNMAEAKGWRQDATVAVRRGELRAPAATTLREAAGQWLDGAREGRITTRSGDPYKPSAVRSYERALRLRALPDLGSMRVADITRTDLQELVERLVGEGCSPSTFQCTLLPLRALYRREIALGRLAVNPTTGLALPAIRGGRDRIADPAEAAALLAVLPEGDQPAWATAMYAGLRRGELRALRVADIDLEGRVVHVHHGWDDIEGRIETKGRIRRRVPIPETLRVPVAAHLLASGRRGDDLVFGATPTSPFAPKRLQDAADAAWKDAGLKRITLHEARHTFASLMIAAGVNAKALSTYMGHANISITLDRYGHLMPGAEDQAAGLLDAYLAGATG
ncbi:MAG TPA: site-specific integrase [Thermoleophilaceae bacterium]|nr:site-specific integrase [Thermoleophilaceae bacterium]